MERLLRNRWHVKYANPAPQTEFNILFHGADLFDYRKVHDIDELGQLTDVQYQTYLNLIDDGESINEHNNYIFTLQDTYLIIPVTDTAYQINISVMGDDVHTYQFNTHDTFDTTFNQQFWCQTHDFSSEHRLYWCMDFNIQTTEYCNAFIITLPTNCRLEISQESIYGSETYSYIINPARHAHIRWAGFAMGSETSNFYKLSAGEGHFFPDLGLTDINLYKLRYDNPELKVWLTNTDQTSGEIIKSTTDFVLHLSYTLTGFEDFDYIIQEQCIHYIDGDIGKVELIDAIEGALQSAPSYAEYYEYVNRERIVYIVDNIIYPYFDNQYGSAIGQPGDIIDFRIGDIEHGKEYNDNSGLIFSVGWPYPDQPVIFAEDWTEGKVPCLYPCRLFMRLSYDLCSDIDISGNKDDLYIDLCYTDDGLALPDHIYDPGIRVNIQDYIFEETI